MLEENTTEVNENAEVESEEIDTTQEESGTSNYEENEQDRDETADSEESDENEEDGSEEESEEDENQEQEVQERINKAIGWKTSKLKEKHTKEMTPYKGLEHVVRHVLNLGEDMAVADVAEALQDAYERQGVHIPQYEEPKNESYSDKESTILGNAEAEEYISSGFYQDVYKELSEKSELTPREETVLNRLSAHIEVTSAKSELNKLGEDPDVIEDESFIEFASKYNADVGLIDIYKDYKKYELGTTQKKNKPAGKQKAKADHVSGFYEKESYTEEEVDRMTYDDFKNHPTLIDRVEKSMLKWK